MSVHAITHKDGSRGYQARWREGDANRSRNFALKRDALSWDRSVLQRRQLGGLALQQLTAASSTLNE
jgi:hypothetical protein